MTLKSLIREIDHMQYNDVYVYVADAIPRTLLNEYWSKFSSIRNKLSTQTIELISREIEWNET